MATRRLRRRDAFHHQLEPSAVWAGHAKPVTGDVRSQLELAVAAKAGGS